MDLFGADEAFMTGTGAGIVRIASLDGEPIGFSAPGPLTECLSEAYRRATSGPVGQVPSPGLTATPLS